MIAANDPNPKQDHSMRFLLIASFPDSLLQFRGALIDALLAREQQVHVAAPNLSLANPLREKLKAKGLRVHNIPLRRTGVNPVADLLLLLHLTWLMRQIRPGRVLCYTVKPVIYGILAAWLANVPKRFALITGLGYAFQGEGKRAPLRLLIQWLYAFSLKHSHLTFFQNPDDENLFRKIGILPSTIPSQVVNGSGVDIIHYSTAPLPPRIRFLLIARLLGDKGVREYVEASRRVRILHPETVFALAGWIDDNPDAISQHELDAWTKEDSILFLGRLSDVRTAIADCSVYVLPSYREGTPRTVLEAMASGRAVITTDTPGCRETVVDGENGFLVPIKSVDALVGAMQRFINDPALIEQMGQRSRALAENKYDVHKVNAVMLRAMDLT